MAEQPLSAADPESVSLPEEQALNTRSLRTRSALSFLLAAGILFFFASRLELDVNRIWDTLTGADYGLYAGAFLIYYLTFPLRALRWRILLKNVGLSAESGVPIPSVLCLAEITYLGWFANCVIPAKLGDAYRGYQLKRASGVSFSSTMGTILAERFIDMAILMALLLGALLALGSVGDSVSKAAMRIFGGGVLLLVVGALGLSAMWVLRERLHTLLPRRIQAMYLRFQEATLGSFRSLPWVLLLSFIIWLTEAGRLFLVVHALDLGLSLPFVIFLSLANSLLTAVPFTPGGLGLVEAGIVGLLLWVGVNIDVAVAVALLDRTISYWSIIALGFPLFLYRRRV